MSIEKIGADGQEIFFPQKSNIGKTELSANSKEFQFKPITDINDISEDLRHYFEEGIDINKSYSNLQNNQLDFNLAFKNSFNERLSISGNYFFQHNKLSTSINFTLNQQVEENGEMKNKMFEYTYNLEAENIFEYRKETKEEKEDILSFVRRISHKVYELAEDDDLKLRSIYFDEEDMKDIIYFEDNKGRQVLMELVNLIILTARLKQGQNKEKEDFEVDYYPERKKTEKEEESTFSVSKFNATLEIKEINTDEAENDKN